MKRIAIVAGLCAGLYAASAVSAEEDITARQAAAKAAAQTLVQQLGEELKKEMAAGGAQQAISVCRDAAPRIAGNLSRENGWRVTRVSTQVRNPMLGTPDAWEQGVLEKFGKRVAQGENLAEMAHSEVVEEPSGRYFRFMKAIGVQAACLHCHGGNDQIAAPVRAELQRHYPFDRATGYSTGDLRGAVSIKQPMNVSPSAGTEP
jgi:hypothetical protein